MNIHIDKHIKLLSQEADKVLKEICENETASIEDLVLAKNTHVEIMNTLQFYLQAKTALQAKGMLPIIHQPNGKLKPIN